MDCFHFSLMKAFKLLCGIQRWSPKSKIFSGPSSEQFGYAVQQFINQEQLVRTFFIFSKVIK